MKIYLLPFVLVFIVLNNKYFSICYAVVNLQMFVLLTNLSGLLKLGITIWLLRNQVFLFSHPEFFPSQQSWVCSWEPFFPFGWWAQMDSDHRPHAYQACALTSWAMSPSMVEVIGFEPMTPCLQGRCSTSWAIPPYPCALRKINAPLIREQPFY